MKHPHFIFVLGMAAWFSTANMETTSIDLTGMLFTEEMYHDANFDQQTQPGYTYFNTQEPEALQSTDNQLESAQQTKALQDEMQREGALQLMK